MHLSTYATAQTAWYYDQHIRGCWSPVVPMKRQVQNRHVGTSERQQYFFVGMCLPMCLGSRNPAGTAEHGQARCYTLLHATRPTFWAQQEQECAILGVDCPVHQQAAVSKAPACCSNQRVQHTSRALHPHTHKRCAVHLQQQHT